MPRLAKPLEIRTSPHLVSGHDADVILWNVLLSLAPVSLFAVYAFGLAALLVLGTATASCLAAEWALARLAGRPSTVGDGSAAVTGLLYGLTLPPGLPLWMAAAGGVVAIALGKAIFGGLGFNPLNPALVGRAVLQAAFPVAMTSWVPGFAEGRFVALPSSTLTFPFAEPVYDALAGATPLAAWKFSRQPTDPADLFFGFVSGSAGETSMLLVLAGGAYLVARNMMSWRIPLAIFATVAALSAALQAADPAVYAGPLFMLTSGGLALGAVFMATDPVTAPITPRGRWIFGVLVGVLVVAIRVWGGMPEGVMYAILLGNATVPLLDRVTQPRVFGTAPRKPAKEPA
jgi:electron transport complex protein RnfD